MFGVIDSSEHILEEVATQPKRIGCLLGYWEKRTATRPEENRAAAKVPAAIH